MDMDFEAIRQNTRARLVMLGELEIEIKQHKSVCHKVLKALDVLDTVSEETLQDMLRQTLGEFGGVQHRPDTHTATVKDAIYEILSKAKKPIHRKEILERVERMGIYVGGKDPVSTMSSHLSAGRPQFKPVGNGYWALSEGEGGEVESIAEARARLMKSG